MDGPSSSKSAVRRRDRWLQATFSSRQKSPQTGWESVVLSGFPAAAEPSLSRRLCPGTCPRALPSDRKGVKLPLPRDHIPPPFLSSRSEFSVSARPGCAAVRVFICPAPPKERAIKPQSTLDCRPPSIDTASRSLTRGPISGH